MINKKYFFNRGNENEFEELNDITSQVSVVDNSF
jgi:hypothetical protein